ncbi:ROK family protein [Escherichia coli]|nr:ROK family protein [Escherichia coli]
MPHIQVENWGLVEALEERFKVTCFVGHDIRSLALAEHYFGASQDCEDSHFSACPSRNRGRDYL